MTRINTAITRQLTIVLFTVNSLHLTALMAIFIVTPVIAVQMTGNDSSAGIPGTAVLLGRAIGAYPVGMAMDRLGRRIGLSTGFLAAIVGTITGALAVMQGTFWILIAGSAFIGMSNSALVQTRYIAAELQPTSKRAKAIGLIVFSGAVGSIGGRLVMELSARLTEYAGIDRLTAPWLLATALMALGLLLNQLLLRPDPMLVGQTILANEAGRDTSITPTPRPMTQIFQRPNVILASAVMALAQLGMTVVMVITTLHMNYAGYSTLSMGTALMLHTLGMFAFSAVTGWLIGLVGRFPVILIGASIFLASVTAGYFANSLLDIYVSTFLLGLGWNLCHISGSTLLSSELRTRERGRAQGISEVVVGGTAAIGSLISGPVYAGYGYEGANIVAMGSVILIVVALAYIRFNQATPMPSAT